MGGNNRRSWLAVQCPNGPTCIPLFDTLSVLGTIMRALIFTLIATCLVAVSFGRASEEKPRAKSLASSVRVTLPLGTIQITYVESDEGMVLDVYCRGTSVRAQRLFLGDGKIAVKYEASSEGFSTPNGPVNAAMIELKEGSTLAVARDQQFEWGAKKGEVYLHTESIKFGMKKGTD